MFIDKGRFYQDFKIRNPLENLKNSDLKTYLLFDDFSGIVVYEVKRFFFPKMEAMSKNDVEAETCEHAQNREHGNALTKPKVEILLVLLLFRLPNTNEAKAYLKLHLSLLIFLENIDLPNYQKMERNVNFFLSKR